jgi:predicted PurR-regulated permease PerM
MNPHDRTSMAVTGIFVILLIHLMLWAANFLIPVTAAVLSYLVFNRPRRFLSRHGFPDSLIAGLFTGFLLIVVALAVLWFQEPVSALIRDLPNLLRDIEQEVMSKSGTLQAVNEAAAALDEAVKSGSDKAAMEVEVVSDKASSLTIMSMAPQVLGQVVFAIVLTFFLIASGDFFVNRMVESFSKSSDKRRVVEIIERIETRLGSYLGGITLINAVLGVCIGIAMSLWGLTGAVSIGLLGFALNYIPFLGAVLGASVAGLLAFIQFDEIWPALGVFATYMALTSIEGQFVTPIAISRRMRLNTPILFLVVAFFAYIWSAVGMVVAVPILIVAKIVCDEIEGLKWLGHFLGDEQERQPKRRRDRARTDIAP